MRKRRGILFSSQAATPTISSAQTSATLVKLLAPCLTSSTICTLPAYLTRWLHVLPNQTSTRPCRDVLSETETFLHLNIMVMPKPSAEPLESASKRRQLIPANLIGSHWRMEVASVSKENESSLKIQARTPPTVTWSKPQTTPTRCNFDSRCAFGSNTQASTTPWCQHIHEHKDGEQSLRQCYQRKSSNELCACRFNIHSLDFSQPRKHRRTLIYVPFLLLSRDTSTVRRWCSSASVTICTIAPESKHIQCPRWSGQSVVVLPIPSLPFFSSRLMTSVAPLSSLLPSSVLPPPQTPISHSPEQEGGGEEWDGRRVGKCVWDGERDGGGERRR